MMEMMGEEFPNRCEDFSTDVDSMWSDVEVGELGGVKWRRE